MHKLFSLKAMLITLLGTSFVSSLMTLPVRANQDNLLTRSSHYDLALNQTFSSYSHSLTERDRPAYPELTDNFKQIVGLTGLAVGTGVIAWHLTRADKASFVHSVPAINNQNSSLLDRVSPKLRQQLLRLVHSPQIANRLLSGAFASHPDRSPNWLAEKVIYDLQRDR